jgi:hypothetical protein
VWFDRRSKHGTRSAILLHRTDGLDAGSQCRDHTVVANPARASMDMAVSASMAPPLDGGKLTASMRGSRSAGRRMSWRTDFVVE